MNGVQVGTTINMADLAVLQRILDRATDGVEARPFRFDAYSQAIPRTTVLVYRSVPRYHSPSS
jgi:hypothetical protein